MKCSEIQLERNKNEEEEDELMFCKECEIQIGNLFSVIIYEANHAENRIRTKIEM